MTSKSGTSLNSSSIWQYFHSAFAVTAIGLAIAGVLGWMEAGTRSPLATSLNGIFICSVLGLLEVSLSFDNAVINASILQRMNAVWRHRFMTWGMLVAVFGMRLVFPLALVGIVAWVDPWTALVLAIRHPEQYASVMHAAHIPISGFGGAFLLMVSARHFFDPEKENHWIAHFERPIAIVGRFKILPALIALIAVSGFALVLHNKGSEQTLSFMIAAVVGVITHLLLEVLSSWLDAEPSTIAVDQARGGFALFLYLEVQDASFSFDGVIGAFAITHDLVIIAIGLSIGAMFVRSLTIMLVEKKTLNKYRYIETGAFYAIGALAVIMLTSTFYELPEIVVGGLSAALIAASFYSSVRHNRLHPKPR